jgi:hypothetical protein
MSSVPRSSVPPWSVDKPDDAKLWIGPPSKIPDVILWPTLTLRSTQASQRHRGYHRSQLQASVCKTLPDPHDVDSISTTFKHKMCPWLANLTAQMKSDVEVKTDARREKYHSAWQTEVQAKVTEISKATGLTIVLCPNPLEYAEAVSVYVEPFNELNKDQNRLLRNFNLLPSPEEESDSHKVQRSDENPTGRIVNPYQPGYDYQSDPESYSKVDIEDS